MTYGENDVRGAVEAVRALLKQSSHTELDSLLSLPEDEFYERVLAFARERIRLGSRP